MSVDRTAYFRERRTKHRERCRKLGICVDCGAPAYVQKYYDQKNGKITKKVVRLRCATHLEENRAR